MAPKESDYLEEAYRRMAEKKTHVSFPQLKYPSLRDDGIKDPVQWLTGKAMDDGAEGLWRVHDRIYDLTSFIDKHPGGAEWLELTKGTDITEAFESHHMNNVVYKMLENYYISDAKTPRNSPFTFKEDGFYKTLKRDVQEVLKTVPKQHSKSSDMILDGLLASCLITSVMACYCTNPYIVWPSSLLAGLSVAWITVCAHNYIHRKTNWRMYLFNLSMWSYRDFRVSHALSHHLYPNTLLDLELTAFEPIIQYRPVKDVPFISNFAFLIEFFIFPFTFFEMYLKRIGLAIFRKGFYRNHFRWTDHLGWLLPLWMWIVSGAPLLHVLYTWVWIICTASFIFITIGYNAAHQHPKVFRDGDQRRDITPDWGMFELETLMDRNDLTTNHFTVMTFFGHHALHHLFPTLDHKVLEYLYPAFYKNVQKFQANFRKTSSFDLFIGQLQMTLKKQPTLLEDEKKQN